MTVSDKEEGAALELRARPRRVVRLNRRVIALLLIGMGLVVLVAFAWGLRQPAHSASDADPAVNDVQRVARAEGLASLPKDYSGVPKLGPPTGEFGHSILKAEKEAGLPALPERPGFRPDAEEDALRAKRLKEQNEVEDAARGAVITSLPGKSNGSRSPETKLLRASDAAVASDAELLGKEKSTEVSDTKIYASGTLQTPRSSYQLMAGTVIPAALVTGINSDLPGQVIATVTENVFDSVTGGTLLVPQGARLMGQYDNQVKWGQSRVLLVWTRLILPDGSSIVLDRLPAVDSQGYAGLTDRTDWHWGRIFAGAAVSTLLGAGAELAAPNRSSGEGEVIIATRESVQDTINQVGQEITRRNLDVQPTLTQRPGLPLRVIVNRDLILRPYGQEQR